MDASEALRQEAESLALNAENRARKLQSDLDEIEASKVAINAELDRAKGAAKRLLNYKPRIGNVFYCPRCWVDRAEQAQLAQVSSPHRNYNIMRCDCGKDWLIPSGR